VRRVATKRKEAERVATKRKEAEPKPKPKPVKKNSFDVPSVSKEEAAARERARLRSGSDD
jgi:hypothetical protein